MRANRARATMDATTWTPAGGPASRRPSSVCCSRSGAGLRCAVHAQVRNSAPFSTPLASAREQNQGQGCGEQVGPCGAKLVPFRCAPTGIEKGRLSRWCVTELHVAKRCKDAGAVLVCTAAPSNVGQCYTKRVKPHPSTAMRLMLAARKQAKPAS